MKLSFTTLGCPAWTLRQIVENAARMGFDGVDFRGLLEDVDISRRPEFTTGLSETRRLFADHGLVVAGVATSARLALPEGAELEAQLDDLRRNVALAAELGSRLVRVFGGRVPQGYTVETALPLLAANLRRAAEEAGRYGVTLVLETHDDWTASALVARVMAEADHPGARVLWDLHHPYRAGGEPPALTYANLGPYTAAIHVKDSLSTPDGGHAYVPVGQGDVPLKEMLDLLVQGGYDGFATLEWEKRWIPDLAEPEEVFPAYVRQMRAWLD